MPKTKISEFSATAGNNTDIDGINISEGCPPSGINDAIRELMAQLKDFQAGTAGDSFNGPVGTTTAAAGAFTTLSASSTVSGTGFSNYLASPPAIGATTPNTGSFTTLTTSSTVTHNGGTANGVAYLNGSKVLTTGSALTFDGTNLSNAGRYIVTANSAGTTDVSYGRLSGGAWINTPTGAPGYLAMAGTAAFYWDSNNLISYIGGTEQMRLTSTGLGIGTSSPAQPLDVVSNSSANAISIRGRSADDIGTLNFGTNAGSVIAQIQNRPNGNELRFLVAGARSQTFYTNGSEQMRLDSSGNLGLGVTPTTKLDVGGASTTQLRVQMSGQADMRIISDTGYGALSQESNMPLILRTNATERARITSGGYFKASNTGAYAGSTALYHELRSDNTTGDWTAVISSSTATAGNAYGLFISYAAAAPNATTNPFLSCSDNVAQRAAIRSNGGIANYQGNDVNLSDRREKTNFAPAKDYLDTICAIPVQTFNYIDQSEDDPGLTLGVVAQDVQAVAPELVMESNWGTKDDPKMRLSIYQTDLQYALMKCIQELKAQNDDLRARVAQLEAK